MTFATPQQGLTKRGASVWIVVLLYLGYLAVSFATWTINGVDYNRIGQNAETTKLTGELLLWSSIGALGVGFGEEMITRGSMVVGLRSRFRSKDIA